MQDYITWIKRMSIFIFSPEVRDKLYYFTRLTQYKRIISHVLCMRSAWINVNYERIKYESALDPPRHVTLCMRAPSHVRM